jgi:hypothetical protein
MRLVCPSCGAVHGAESFLNDDAARQFLLIFSKVPQEVQGCLMSYLSYFRSSKGNGLRWVRALNLLREVVGLIQADEIRWENRKVIQNNVKYWRLAFEKMIDNPPKRLPLKNHNYLRVIAYEFAEEEDKRLEEERETMRRIGWSRVEDDKCEDYDPQKVRELIDGVLKRKKI